MEFNFYKKWFSELMLNVFVVYQSEDTTPVSSPTLSSPPFGLKPRTGENHVVLLTHMVPMCLVGILMVRLAWVALHFRGWCTFWALSLSSHFSSKRVEVFECKDPFACGQHLLSCQAHKNHIILQSGFLSIHIAV